VSGQPKMSFNVEDFLNDLNKLRAHGYDLQTKGQVFVRIAESGAAVAGSYQKALPLASGAYSGSTPVQQRLDEIGISGALAASALKSANEKLQSSQTELAVPMLSALTGVTLTTVATQTLIQEIVKSPPIEKVDISDLTTNSTQPPFSEEELDALLIKFRDLPDRRQGAWSAFYSTSEDAVAQAAHSMRDVLSTVVAQLGKNEAVQASKWYSSQEKTTYPERLRFLLYGPELASDAKEENFIKTQTEEFFDTQKLVSKTAHGSGKYHREEVKLGLQKIEQLLFLILFKWAS
jgi:hypothetical protein